MQTYLTETAQKKHYLEIPRLIFDVIFLILLLATTWELIKETNIGAAAMGAVFSALLGWRIYRILQRRNWRMSAAAVDSVLRTFTEEKVPVDRLECLLVKRVPEKSIHAMIEKGYLKNVMYDRKERCLLLHLAPGMRTSGKLIRVVCPNCGAVNQVRQGEQAQCEYCDRPIAEEHGF
ncbi:MAG: hypothetical protein Q4B09_02255 [Lachnospiraceae bacterium]|nr:hypothetical protein [Lachnospiraceae bacterium]